MKKPVIIRALVVLLIMSFLLIPQLFAEDQIIQLENGKQVVLHDDFTGNLSRLQNMILIFQ